MNSCKFHLTKPGQRVSCKLDQKNKAPKKIIALHETDRALIGSVRIKLRYKRQECHLHTDIKIALHKTKKLSNEVLIDVEFQSKKIAAKNLQYSSLPKQGRPWRYATFRFKTMIYEGKRGFELKRYQSFSQFVFKQCFQKAGDLATKIPRSRARTWNITNSHQRISKAINEARQKLLDAIVESDFLRKRQNERKRLELYFSY